MKHMKIHLFNLALAIILPCSAYAKVDSMLLEKVIHKDGYAFTQVGIKCAGRLKKQRIVRRNLRGVEENSSASEQWCSEENPNQCSHNKYELARTLCNLKPNETTTKIAKGNHSPKETLITTGSSPATAAVIDDNSQTSTSKFEQLVNEQLLIEEQRILIEQRRLELNKKEIDLRRLRANIES